MFLALLAAFALPRFEVRGRIPLPGGEGWGRPVFDKPSHRLYIPRETRLHVVDAGTGKLVGDIANLPGARGVAIVPEMGAGFVTLAKSDRVLVFDLKIFAEIKRIPVGGEPDAIAYDARTKRLLVANRKGHSVTLVDPNALYAEASVAVDGTPSALVVGERGTVFVTTESGIQRLDVARRRASAAWPAKGVSDLALDPRRGLLFAAGDGTMTILDAKTGAVRGAAPLGKGASGVASDYELGLAFGTSADGALAVVHAKDAMPVVQTLPTVPGAYRTAIDPDDHRLYLLAPNPEKPGTAIVVVVARVRGE